MAKIIKIDTSKWCTVSEYAKLENEKIGTISARLARSKDKSSPNPIKYWEIKELHITLLERPKDK
jgi:hypothetical protein